MIKNLIHLLNSLVFFVFVILIGLMPFRLMYYFSNFVAWMLRSVFRYRIDLVSQNLSYTNLDLTEKEKKKLIKKIYRNLSDILLEGIKSFTMTQTSIKKRHKVLNPELIKPYYESRQSLILVTGHIGNWEWGSMSAGIQTDFRILGFYKPLKNKFINKFLLRSRAKFGTILAPIKQTSISFKNYLNAPTVFLMAADQNPSKPDEAHWIDFLGRKTAFLHGPEKHSKNNKLPVVFTEINRVKRGKYELVLSILVEDPSKYSTGEITEIYARKLESVIRLTPESWLWTHRRWKHKAPTA
jgi:Kdo2-lipid IVA lauroyltransferase/acyltransferase